MKFFVFFLFFLFFIFWSVSKACLGSDFLRVKASWHRGTRELGGKMGFKMVLRSKVFGGGPFLEDFPEKG